ncbi:MAG TPA: ATP-binding cassette domain-containing protein [Flavobacteriales bacterium]|nr:ATP-binding cassette domain-containing protein [Flavobacteriales bacterium]
MIEAQNISKSFGETKVFKDVSITFEEGKTNLVIGQSGSGKTVLMKCMVGLHEIDSGKIIYDDRIFSNPNRNGSAKGNERKSIRKDIGMMFQGGALFDSLTVEENVIFPLSMFTQMSQEEMVDRANVCLNRVDLINANKLYPAELSGGMQKRVAIARAMSMSPKYLLCDEPNSGLDPKTAIIIDNLIHEITHEYKITTIINTHDMNSVMEIGDKIIFIHNGEKWWEGSNQEILKEQNIELNDFIFAAKYLQKLKE